MGNEKTSVKPDSIHPIRSEQEYQNYYVGYHVDLFDARITKNIKFIFATIASLAITLPITMVSNRFMDYLAMRIIYASAAGVAAISFSICIALILLLIGNLVSREQLIKLYKI